MLFSVVIPTYNRLAYLKRTLDSVWTQTLRDYEVIVVDDGSTDGTSEYLESLVGRIGFVRQQNCGAGAARNVGAARACGDYLAFLDSDDWWFPWTLATFAALVREHGSPAILGARMVEFGDETELDRIYDEHIRAEVFADYFASSRSGHFVGAGMAVVRREEFISTGGFTRLRINCEDHDLVLRLGNAPGFVQVAAPVTLGWRRHVARETAGTDKTIAGINHLIRQERGCSYPGGAYRRWDRRRIIMLHTRAVSLDLLANREIRCALRLYRETLDWHLRLGRWKYLLGFPALMLRTLAK